MPTWGPALAPQADSVTPTQPTRVPRAMLRHVCYTVSSRRLAPRLPSWLPSTSPARAPRPARHKRAPLREGWGVGVIIGTAWMVGHWGRAGCRGTRLLTRWTCVGSLRGGVTQACLLPSGWQKREAMARGGVQKLGLHRPLPGCLGWSCSRQTGCVSSGAGAWRVRVCVCQSMCVRLKYGKRKRGCTQLQEAGRLRPGWCGGDGRRVR